MKKDKIEYKTECLAYLKLKDAGKKVTIRAYCERRSQELKKTVSFAYFKKVLGQIKQKGDPGRKPANGGGHNVPPGDNEPAPNWPAIRDAYLAWKFASLAEVSRYVGMHHRSKAFRNATAGWKAARDAAERPGLPITIEALAKQRAADKARGLCAEILAIHYNLLDLLGEVSKGYKKWEDAHKSPWFSREAVRFVIDMQTALEKLLPNVQGLQKLKQVQQIFQGLKAGGMDINQAAIEFAMLGVDMPKPLEIMLTNYQPEDEPLNDGEEITDEMIMKRRARLMMEIEEERTGFVTERKQVVAEMKKEMAGSDSFAAQAALQTKV